MAKKIPSKVKEIQNWKIDLEQNLDSKADLKSISFSQLSVYLNCPKCWQRSYLLKEAPNVSSIHLIFGTAIHECLQTWLDVMYNKTVKESEELNLGDLLLDKMKNLYVEQRKLTDQNFSTPQELFSFYQDGLAILDYVKKHRKTYFSSKEWLVGCEVPIFFKLRDGFFFKGYIDILTYSEETDTWKIWDIKTSTYSWSQETKKNKVKISQVLLYKYFLSQQFGIDLDKIEVEYFIVKRKIPEDPEFPAAARRVQEFVPANKKPSVSAAVKTVLDFCNSVLTESGTYCEKEYGATPSKASCKWCIFRDTCEFRFH